MGASVRTLLRRTIVGRRQKRFDSDLLGDHAGPRAVKLHVHCFSVPALWRLDFGRALWHGDTLAGALVILGCGVAFAGLRGEQICDNLVDVCLVSVVEQIIQNFIEQSWLAIVQV